MLAAPLLSATVAWAEGQAQLLLPIVSAIALGASAVETVQEAHRPPSLLEPPPPRNQAGILPHRLRIPDGYLVDLEREPARFAAPVNGDRVVAFDVLQRPQQGLSLSFVYDDEERGPFPGTAEVVRFVAEIRF
jgi:hypothetical protein